MADRPDVKVAAFPLTLLAMIGLAATMVVALASVPFRRPWRGVDSWWRNIALSATRESIRAFMGYAVTLRTPELRGVERAIDRLLGLFLPRFIRDQGVATLEDEIAGVPGTWYTPAEGPRLGVILYLHGGGYLATTPKMYGLFTAWLARVTSCDVLVPDYRLAPEFPFPAGLDDVTAVYEALLEDVDPEVLMVAGDSGGGGLATSLLQVIAQRDLPRPRAVALFSPEVDLAMTDPSAVLNADRDILPREIPVTPYLQGGVDPTAAIVSAVNADPAAFPPLYVSVGGDEMFHDAIVRFVRGVREAGVRTVLFDEPGMFHVYPILMPWMGASQRLYHDLGRRFAARREGRVLPDEERLVTEDWGHPPEGELGRTPWRRLRRDQASTTT